MPYTSDYARTAMGEKKTPASKTVGVTVGNRSKTATFSGSTKKTLRGSKTKMKNSEYGSITERVKKGKGGSTDMTGAKTRVKTTARKQKTVTKNKATGAKTVEIKRFKKA